MNKNSSFALVALALTAAAGFSLPAVAEDDSGTSFNDDLVRAALSERGVHVAGLAETAFGTIQATVRLPDGSTEFQYFDAATLQPVAGPSGATRNSRVLSDLDVGVEPAQPPLTSLTWDDPPGGD